MKNTLDGLSKGRDNNLNFIRFVAACLVIFSHSYPITGGKNAVDSCWIMTSGRIDFGGIAVSIFFFYGGFLILQSMERIKKTVPYFKARILRIIPPLAFVTFVMTFIVGPLLTTESMRSYFTNGGTYKYLLNSVFVLVHDLPGVFVDNIYGTTVNGALWTLPVEFICYILCFVFYKLGFMKKVAWTILPVFVVYFLTNSFLASRSPLMKSALRPMMLFYMGMLAYIYREKIKPCMRDAIIGMCLLIAGLFVWKEIYDFLLILAVPVILLQLGYGARPVFARFGTKCEVSYGMYLWGWPIQQMLSSFFVRMTPFQNSVLSATFAIGGGVL